MNKRWLLPILATAMLALSGCAYRSITVESITVEAEVPQRLWVIAFPAACAITQPCYLVRTSPGGEQSTFDGTIEGFSFVPGVEYELVVGRVVTTRIEFSEQSAVVTTVENSPPHYVVKEVVAQGLVNTVPAAPPVPTPTLAGILWTLASIETGDAPQPVEAGAITLEFGMDTGQGFGAISGLAGCNRFAGTYRDRAEGFRVQAVATTRMACETPEGIMELEEQFLLTLGRVAGYEFRGDELHLLDAAGEVLLRFVKAS